MSGLIRTLYWVQAFEGDYKWILYGDDDTFFFVDGVLELLQDFDPSLPYFITGENQCSTLHTSCLQQDVLMQALLSAFRSTSM